MTFLEKIVCTLKKAPLFRSKISFLLLFPVLVLYIWLNYFHYRPNVLPESIESKRVSGLNVKDLRSECDSVASGMTIRNVDNLVVTRNKRILATMSDRKVIQYWIAKNFYTEHLPSRDVCIVEFNVGGKVATRKLAYIEPSK